jgi:peroxiredoxin
MRTIVPVLFAAACCAAQSPPTENPQIQNLEKGLTAKPDNPGARNQILQLATDPNVTADMPSDRVIETRRRHILWLIEHHPEQRNNFLRATQLIPARGPWADPEGYAESVRMWKERAARPGVSPEIIANAAIYLKATDRPAARVILEAALKDHPADGALSRAVGMVDAASMAGVTGIGDRDQFATDAALQNSKEAKAAREEIESSGNAFLLGGAAQVLWGNLIQNQGQLTLGQDDAETLAGRWLRRAIQIAPSTEEWKTMLASVVRSQANRAEDPRERARLFSEAMGLTPDRDKSGYLADLAKAEFEAGDDEAAGRDARRAIEAAAELAKRNAFQAANLINRGDSVLGRIALARGDTAEARNRLRASLIFPVELRGDANNFRANGPDMSLAQDMADAGERDAVIEYLQASRQFWIYDRGNVDRYIRAVKAGRKREAFANFQPSSATLVNRPAPPFKLREPAGADTAGKEWTLASLAGQPAALIFWNASCQTCAEQIAEYIKAAPAGIRVLAVNVGDSDAAVRAFVEKNFVSATILEANKAVALAYEVDTYPSVVVIDAHGRVTQYQVGAAANPRQTLDAGTRPRVAAPVLLEAASAERGVTLAWHPVPGAQSYVVEWEPRDKTGWPSDRDGFLHVVPTREARVQVECSGTMRWRVFAVGSGVASDATAWQFTGHLQ